MNTRTPERPSTENRTPAPPVVSVSPSTLKRVLERLGYTATATNWACWAMTRADGIPVMLPRLGGTVATEILQATADRVGIPLAQMLELGGAR